MTAHPTTALTMALRGLDRARAAAFDRATPLYRQARKLERRGGAAHADALAEYDAAVAEWGRLRGLRDAVARELAAVEATMTADERYQTWLADTLAEVAA